jgi:hypothetical protein
MEKMAAQSLADLVRFAGKVNIRSQTPETWHSPASPAYWTKVQYLSRFNSHKFCIVCFGRSLSTEKAFESIDQGVFSEEVNVMGSS